MENIFLVGPMGSGKTTIGRQVATRLNIQFYDSDKEIEERTGADISLIFEIEGEEGFREREIKMIEELTSKRSILLATGGGAVLSEQNRRCLMSRGQVIYLKSTPEKLLDRTSKDKKRPLLNTEDRKKNMLDMLEKRAPLYEEIADFIVQTDNQVIKQIVNNICEQLDLS
jgi:shikimate kinase